MDKILNNIVAKENENNIEENLLTWAIDQHQRHLCTSYRTTKDFTTKWKKSWKIDVTNEQAGNYEL